MSNTKHSNRSVSVVFLLAEMVGQASVIMASLKAYGDLLKAMATTRDSLKDSSAMRFFEALSTLFTTWAAIIEQNAYQVKILLLKSFWQTIKQQNNTLPSKDSVLIEKLSGLFAKVAFLVDKCSKALKPPNCPPLGFSLSMHASMAHQRRSWEREETPCNLWRGRRCISNVFCKKTHIGRGVSAYPGPILDSVWLGLGEAGHHRPHYKACKGRIFSKFALEITKAFEFCSLSSAPPAPLLTMATYASASGALPAPSVSHPLAAATTGVPTPAQPKPKPKALVVHVTALKDLTKILRVVFSMVVSNFFHHCNKGDVKTWVRGELQHTGKGPNKVVSLNWHKGRVNVYVHFQTQPMFAICNRLNQKAGWLANMQGTACMASVDFYTSHHMACTERVANLTINTTCEHVYYANCDSVKHTLSSQKCPFSRCAGDRNAKWSFSKNLAKFTAAEMLQRSCHYDGAIAVNLEHCCRQSGKIVEASEQDDVMQNNN
ncbi:hypothetical protein PHLGIDRAFT_17036 [Phlebiopsis gigantea 11061_1 CR5-6]|uniref:C3H1-type domain-containing protein n=1 Tax=Phlebiopsis gigantea (strain 11061_1 CR5-6) TaxID=745531 RepID=A0A0C3S278_PHLG1|nr:hypothetical protein PHLGIDRAFT_17036 [Phlebiopsis gigantea 11061_1 CR5-6]